jgi:FlaA1/EpsC-like NDP-sugar epimerase
MRLRARLQELGIRERVIAPLAEIVAGVVNGAVGGVSGANANGAAGSVGSGVSGGDNAVRMNRSEVSVSELIGRVPYGIDRRAVSGILADKRVLITGAGGSIGSEIARIVATFKPEQVVLMERSENALFEIDRQIARRFPNVRRSAILHDVVDAEQTLNHLQRVRPHAVFHAAAHKHVPLMEDHPSHAVNNNLFGTKSIADAAAATGVERFVLISSDKAVNPTSVMGATKRLAEMYIQALASGRVNAKVANSKPTTRFSMVRFGNVLGSACSVLPIWGQQLSEGGPITVTDPRMTRYFMTIHEAATLVIQSAAIERREPGASVYVLDMGEPVRILDLAQRFVRAHGFECLVLDKETPRHGLGLMGDAAGRIEIEITGARPGEKLHEELAYAAENLVPTNYPGILSWGGALSEAFSVEAMVTELAALRPHHERTQVVEAIQRHVPEMIAALAGRSAADVVARVGPATAKAVRKSAA